MLPLALRISPVEAGTIMVPDDYGTIQGAINQSTSGGIAKIKSSIKTNRPTPKLRQIISDGNMTA